MSARSLIPVLLLPLFALGGWTLAQQEGPAQADPAPLAPAIPRFSVASVDAGYEDTPVAVLLENATGKTWVLYPYSQDPLPTWIPGRRIDDTKEAEKWMKEADKFWKNEPSEELEQKTSHPATGRNLLRVKPVHADESTPAFRATEAQ